jgi:flagellar capping protein FliD
MAKYGEWNQKGATLSDVTAKKEYGVDREFIIKGIEAGQLEYRNGAIWGNPYLRILRSQLEKYISEKLGKEYLSKVKNETELKKIKSEISSLSKKMKALQSRKIDLEKTLGK